MKRQLRIPLSGPRECKTGHSEWKNKPRVMNRLAAYQSIRKAQSLNQHACVLPVFPPVQVTLSSSPASISNY